MKRPLTILVTSVILYFFVLAVYLLGQAVLDQHGLEYRSWVSALGFFWIYILPFPAGAVLLLALYRHLKSRFPGKAFRTFCVIVFAVYLLATLLGCFSYELALWHNLWHNAWHARSADDDEPSDFAVYARRVSAYLVMIVALCLTLFA